MTLTDEQRHRVLRRGVARIIPEDEFVERLDEGLPLRLKMGFDPSAPDIHLGHAVGLRKLRQLQDLGHTVVIIVGDWTAQIGDPSGRSATRPMLTHEQVVQNAETYLAQFFKIVDRDRAEVRWQSDWFGPFSLADVIRLTSKFTVAQFLQRDDFANRFQANQPIAITELLYPLLQAYDSVAIKSDVEFGGTDQMFNLLVGRDLQEMEGQRPQQCFLMPMLPGTDGVQKMSKSLGNYIGIDEPARRSSARQCRCQTTCSHSSTSTSRTCPIAISPKSLRSSNLGRPTQWTSRSGWHMIWSRSSTDRPQPRTRRASSSGRCSRERHLTTYPPWKCPLETRTHGVLATSSSRPGLPQAPARRDG